MPELQELVSRARAQAQYERLSFQRMVSDDATRRREIAHFVNTGVLSEAEVAAIWGAYRAELDRPEGP